MRGVPRYPYTYSTHMHIASCYSSSHEMAPLAVQAYNNGTCSNLISYRLVLSSVVIVSATGKTHPRCDLLRVEWDVKLQSRVCTVQVCRYLEIIAATKVLTQQCLGFLYCCQVLVGIQQCQWLLLTIVRYHILQVMYRIASLVLCDGPTCRLF